MDTKKIGRQTVRFSSPPSIAGYGSAVGQMEREGPLGQYFDFAGQDDTFGEKSWEKAETALQKKALNFALEKAGLQADQLDYIFAGDLLNQCIATSYSVRTQNVPFFGLYGACSTMAESLSLSAMLLDGGFGQTIAALTSSHFCSAERQYRNPLEYGGQKPPTAQWTATGSAAVILTQSGKGPFLTHVTTGKVTDKGITDANNMGAAMAPAAYSTLQAHFQDTGREPSFYDLIVTGDLAAWARRSSPTFSGGTGWTSPKTMTTAAACSLTPKPRTFTPAAPAAGAAPWCWPGTCCGRWRRAS